MVSLPADVTRLLTTRLAEEQQQRRLPSVVAGVVRDGALAWSGAAGTWVTDGAGDTPPTSDTQYRIGSITKTFVAVAVMRLREEGLLRLTDPIRRHVSDLDTDATIAQVLSHGAGIRAETAGPWWERTRAGDWEDLASPLDRATAVLRPGRGFHYSNVGFGMLGEMIGRLRGRSWAEVVTDELLRPLGMRRTTLRPQAPAAAGFAVHPWAPVLLGEPEHDAGAMAPAGQLWSTLEDLARWGTFLYTGHDEVLGADTLAEMREPLVVVDLPDEPWVAAHGLGLQVWNTGGRRSFGHGGSMPGFLAALQVAEGCGDGVLVASNATAGLRGELVADIATIVREHAPTPVRPWRPASVDAGTLALTGTWYWGPQPLILRALPDGGLDLAPSKGPGRASRFRPVDHGGYRGLDGYFRGERLRVVRDAGGRLTHLDLASFILTRAPYDPAEVVPGGVDATGWFPS